MMCGKKSLSSTLARTPTVIPNLNAKTSVHLIFFILGMNCPTTLAKQSTRFQVLSDDYFPKGSEYVEGRYRKWFDKTIFNPHGRAKLAKTERMLYDAVRGDSAAFHAFVRSENRSGPGEFSMTWHYDCALLLLVLGDERFATLLEKEDRKTKAIVGATLNGFIDWKKHPFPNTYNIWMKNRIDR
jgi:hypothetical protein